MDTGCTATKKPFLSVLFVMYHQSTKTINKLLIVYVLQPKTLLFLIKRNNNLNGVALMFSVFHLYYVVFRFCVNVSEFIRKKRGCWFRVPCVRVKLDQKKSPYILWSSQTQRHSIYLFFVVFKEKDKLLCT